MTQTPDCPDVRHGADDLLRGLESYWSQIRGARHLPVRTDVDPTRIDTALPHAFILERVAPGVARFRVAGQRVAGIFGMDVRGMPMSSLFEAEARPVLASCLERCFALPAIVAADLTIARGRLRRPLVAKMILLPLEGTGGEVNRALGAIVTDQADLAHGVNGIGFTDVGAIRCDPVFQTLTTWPKPVARPQMAQKPKAADGRPPLYLVVSND